jgi:hypothetical protein
LALEGGRGGGGGGGEGVEVAADGGGLFESRVEGRVLEDWGLSFGLLYIGGLDTYHDDCEGLFVARYVRCYQRLFSQELIHR